MDEVVRLYAPWEVLIHGDIIQGTPEWDAVRLGMASASKAEV